MFTQAHTAPPPRRASGQFTEATSKSFWKEGKTYCHIRLESLPLFELVELHELQCGNALARRYTSSCLITVDRSGVKSGYSYLRLPGDDCTRWGENRRCLKTEPWHWDGFCKHFAPDRVCDWTEDCVFSSFRSPLTIVFVWNLWSQLVTVFRRQLSDSYFGEKALNTLNV